MAKLISLTVFFPAYNDENTITPLVRNAYKIAVLVSSQFRILVINDGSTDNTGSILADLKNEFPSLEIINNRHNQGYGSVLRTGFHKATGDWVFYTDGDGQYDIKELPRLVQKAQSDIDVINGYKRTRQDSLVRKILGAAYNRLAHRLYRLPIRDVDCDFRLIRVSALKKIHLTASSGMICVELINKLANENVRFAEVPISHHPRRHGDSQFFKLTQLLNMFHDHVRYYSKLKSTGIRGTAPPSYSRKRVPE